MPQEATHPQEDGKTAQKTNQTTRAYQFRLTVPESVLGAFTYYSI